MSLGLDVGLSVQTYRVWKTVCHGLGLEWDRLSTSVSDPRSIWAWADEVVIERFHPSILRRLAEKALAAGEPMGTGEAWTAAGGTAGHWLELDDFLRTLRGHREIEECALMVAPEVPTDGPDAGEGPVGGGLSGSSGAPPGR